MEASCPKCSYTIRLPKGKKAGDFICPKHKVPLKPKVKEEEKPKTRRRRRR